MTTQPLEFFQLLIIILTIGAFILIILSISNVTFQRGKYGFSFNKRKKNNVSYIEEGISPHSVCRHRFDILNIYSKLSGLINEIAEIEYSKTNKSLFSYTREELDTYITTILNLYQERLNELAPGDEHSIERMINYQFFYLLFRLASIHTFKLLNRLIETNGFLRFENKPQLLADFKEEIFNKLKTDWSGILDIYYYNSLIIPRSEINELNEPENIMKNTTDKILDKMVTLTINNRNKIEEKQKKIKDYILSTFDINIELSLNENIKISRQKKKEEKNN